MSGLLHLSWSLFLTQSQKKMKFNLKKSIQVLERSPKVLEHFLLGLDESWIQNNEGPKTWNPFDMVGHLVHLEKNEWIPRMRIILEQRANYPFPPVDRYAMLVVNKGRKLRDLLIQFKQLRGANMLALKTAKLNDRRLDLWGVHPEFGQITLRQLLSAWVVSDLDHLAQISRVMAWQYRHEVGPYETRLPILDWKAEIEQGEEK